MSDNRPAAIPPAAADPTYSLLPLRHGMSAAVDLIRDDVRNGVIPPAAVAEAVGLSVATVREWAERPAYVATSYDARLSRWAMQEQRQRDAERWERIQDAAARHDDGQPGPWSDESQRHHDLMWLVHAYARARECPDTMRHAGPPQPDDRAPGLRPE